MSGTSGTSGHPTATDHLAAAIVLASLPDIGPVRLRGVLAEASPTEALAAIRAGRALSLGPALRAHLPFDTERQTRFLQAWQDVACGLDGHELLERHRAAGVAPVLGDDPRLPAALVDDPDRASVLFVRGDISALHGPRAAVVGTRRCTRYGFDVARWFGRELATAGVRVVSGLAIGCDAAAHRGVLDAANDASRREAEPAAPPVAVVGCGLDVVYPQANRTLWEEVAAVGAIISEHPLGTRPAAWRFPARNRLIAALGTAVVVVESGERGGSLITAELALDRQRDVFVVPGPVTSPASVGALHLLADGANVASTPDDVLLGLGIVRPRPGAEPGSDDADHPADPHEAELLALIGPTPTSLDRLLAFTDLAPGAATAALTRLELDGRVSVRGGWIERTEHAPPGGRRRQER